MPRQYNYEDEGSISEDLKCVVCLEPFVEPIMHSQCRNVFCSACIVELAKCPVCRGAVSKAELASVPRMINNMLGELMVICPACTEPMARSFFDAHSLKCGNQVVQNNNPPPSAPPMIPFHSSSPVKPSPIANSSSSPHCPNRSNPAHQCSQYCFDRYSPSSPSFSPSSPSSTPSTSNAQCPNKSNPAHKCTQYCKDRYGPNATYVVPPPPPVTYVPAPTPATSHSTTPTPSHTTTNTTTGTTVFVPAAHRKIHETCPNISNPHHSCTDYCRSKYPLDGATRSPTAAAAAAAAVHAPLSNAGKKANPNPDCPNRSNPAHQCTQYCWDRYNPLMRALDNPDAPPDHEHEHYDPNNPQHREHCVLQ